MDGAHHVDFLDTGIVESRGQAMALLHERARTLIQQAYVTEKRGHPTAAEVEADLQWCHLDGQPVV